MIVMALIDEILALEWEQFRAVENEDGPASCQQAPRPLISCAAAN